MTTATKKIFSLRIDTKLRSQLDQEAKLEDRSTSYIVNDLIENFVAYKKAKRKRIEEGLAEVKRGEVFPASVVMKAMEKWSKSDSGKPFIFSDYVQD